MNRQLKRRIFKSFKAVKGWVPILFMVFLPYVVYLMGLPMWLGRIIGVGLWLGLLSIASFWFALNLNKSKIKPGTKFDPPRNEHRNNKIEIFLRSVVFLFGVMMAYQVYIPYLQDVYQLARSGSPSIVVSQIREVERSRSISKEIHLVKDDQRYSLMFPLEPYPSPGNDYEFWILPRSKIILSYKRVRLARDARSGLNHSP